MSVDSNVAPVIIKRKKVSGGHGHHGGAWKVAYADFVTAMMAFFMLMWLLNATTEKQRKGLADYFNPTVAIARISGGGSGALNGESVMSENTLARSGIGASSLNPSAQDKASGDGSEDDSGEEDAEETFETLEELLLGRGGESMVDDGLQKHMVTRVTDEGLVVEMFETADARLFQSDGTPTRLLEQLAGVIARVSDVVTNPLAVEGHVAASPLVLARNPSWDSSTQHAATFRSLLLRNRLEDTRIARVTAHADREPTHRNPMDVRNNRLEVIFLRQK